LGMGWEAVASQLYSDMFWQPKVLQLDGVSGHPDGYSFMSNILNYQGGGPFGDLLVLEEFKLTAKSLREKGARVDQPKDIRSEWMWNGQAMSYLAMASKTLPYFKVNPDAPLLARFHVMWAMGAYEKYTLDERYLRYLVEYEREEVERTWQMVQANKGMSGTGSGS